MKDSADSMRMRTSPRAIVAAGLLAVGLLFGVGVERGQADESVLPAGLANYPAGTITAVYQTTFQINGRTFSLAPDAVLVDQRGNPLEATAIRAEIEVKYHLQKGSTETIDWMLLVLPR